MSKDLVGYSLAARSHFSIGESMLSPEKIVEVSKRRGFHTVALVDTMSVSGMIKFVTDAKKEGIKPIVGCRLRVVMDLDYRAPKKSELKKPKDNPEWYPKVYVKNEQGMKDLMALLSKANDEDHFYFKPRLGIKDLINALAKKNLVISTGDFNSLFHVDCKAYNYKSIVALLLLYCDKPDVFLELSSIDTILFDTLAKKVAEIASEFEVQTVLTYPVLYENEKDAGTLDVLSTITNGNKIVDPWRHIPYVRDFSIKPPSVYIQKAKELAERMKKKGVSVSVKSAVEGMKMLSDRCDYTWEKQAVSLPKIVEDEHKTLMQEVMAGWKERIGKETLGYKPDASLIPKYKERLAYEIGILRKMGFERYFLVVQDLVKWSKGNGIMVGPARGSAAGSLVAYLMGITDVDPIRFDLIFERFINPDRLDLPDADLDFMSTRRGEVIDYLVEKYGQEYVAGISNYSTLASASALRDCGRVYGLSGLELSPTKLVPKEGGKSSTLTVSAELVPELAEFRDTYVDIWHHATGLEGVLKNMGKHAAGVIVANEPIVNRAVVEKRSGAMVVNWDKRFVEDWGLVKIDILGLSTLDILKIAVENIEERTGECLSLLSLPLDDYETMKEFGKGNTIGVFQFTSSGMRHLLKSLAQVDTLTFDDISAATALYRPGPMESGLMDDYIAIKQGIADPEYDHPNMKPALEVTGGVIIYQEQVMQLAQDLAGYSMAEADGLRKIMGKKLRDEMLKQKSKFVDGCVTHSEMDKALAGELFDKIEKFAGYGFNKSHSVAYTIISYWCMYLKVHHKAEYFAATLTVTDKDDQLRVSVNDAKKNNVTIMPPDVNISSDKFVIMDGALEDEIYLYTPFGKLKGLSDKTCAAIAEARVKAGVKFKSKEHFLESVNKRSVNKRHQAVLDSVGAFASIEEDQIQARHPDRLKDQLELMPGLIVEYVKADRQTNVKEVTSELSNNIKRFRACSECDLQSKPHCRPTAGGVKLKYMVVSDTPSWSEEKEEIMFSGKSTEPILQAMEVSGVRKSNGFFTSLVRATKSEDRLTNEQVNGCKKYLDEEIAIIKPPVIVCLGGASIRHFVPDVKGGWKDLAGQVIYNKELDANIVFGINPGMIAFREEAQSILNDVFGKVAEIIGS